jgi:hypothetical protein
LQIFGEKKIDYEVRSQSESGLALLFRPRFLKFDRLLEELLALGFVGLALIALTHTPQGGVRIQTGIMPVAPFKSKRIPPDRFHILQ